MAELKKITHHSLIESENGLIKKIIEPNFCFHNGEREALILDMYTYRSKLQSMGVPVADKYALRLQDGKIVEETRNCGVDGYTLLKNCGKSDVYKILRKIVLGICPVLREKKLDVVPDPHPANWCFANGDINYIDFQPARYQKADGIKLVGFPQPTGKEYEWSVDRYYSRFFLLRVLRFNTKRSAGPWVDEILERIIRKECSEEVSREYVQGIESLLEQQVRNGLVSLKEALSECDEWHVDDLRELAMLVSEYSESSAEAFLGKILELTRADFNLTIEERRVGIEKAKSLFLL